MSAAGETDLALVETSELLKELSGRFENGFVFLTQSITATKSHQVYSVIGENIYTLLGMSIELHDSLKRLMHERTGGG